MNQVPNATILYNQHVALCNNDDNSFYCTKQTVLGRILEIFNYRLVSWGQFSLPGALEARGIAYDVTDDIPVIVSRPMPKFFNFTEGTDPHVGYIRTVMDKRDGSLASSAMIGDVLRIKSKGSFNSDQAVWSQQIVESNQALHSLIMIAENAGHTVNMEFTAPFNRIVVPYQTAELRILNIRHKESGVMLYGDQLRTFYHGVYNSELFVDYSVIHEPDMVGKMAEFQKETIGEGYVCEIVRPDGTTYLVKQKNDSYAEKHKLKDNIGHDGNLADCIISGSADDLRAMFYDDPYTLNRISEFEEMIVPKFNKWVKEIENFTEQNKHLAAKDFASMAKEKFGNSFVWAMNLYRGREVDFVEVAQKYKEEMFGIKKPSIVSEE